jgi:hypothetical protein
MHAELEEELGREGAATTLTQIGLIQGLHDARRVLDDCEAQHAVLPPSLAIRFAAVRNAHPPGSIEMVGSWPERTEAGAHLSVMGQCSDPACHLSAGYTSGWLSGTMDADILVLESHCAATGDDQCLFVARELDAWRADPDARTESLLRALPFDAIRELVQARSPARPRPADSHGGPESDVPVVHIWGPVMVIPFADGEEALRAVELIGCDAAAAEVSVIVVDLADKIIDEAFGAMTLEQIVGMADSYGAETIFAGVATLSESVISGLDRQPLMVRKNLDEAVAAAFQIAQAQRIVV